MSVCMFSDEIRKSSEISDKFNIQRLDTTQNSFLSFSDDVCFCSVLSLQTGSLQSFLKCAAIWWW